MLLASSQSVRDAQRLKLQLWHIAAA